MLYYDYVVLFLNKRLVVHNNGSSWDSLKYNLMALKSRINHSSSKVEANYQVGSIELDIEYSHQSFIT